MKFININELCPCRSGKKYEYCCQHKNLVGITQHMESELLELKQDLLQFSVENYQRQIDECVDECLEEILFEDDETYNQAAAQLMIWIIFSLPIASNKQTILQTYIKKHGKKIKRPALLEALHSWDGIAPSVYRVLKDNDEIIEVEDIFTLEKKIIHTFGLKEEFFSGQSLEEYYVIGTVIQYHNRSLFFTTFQVVEDNSKIEDILVLYEFNKDEFEFNPKEIMLDFFPEIIEVIYNEPLTSLFDSDEIHWDTVRQKQVIELVSENLKLPKEIEPMIEALSTTLWKIYCTKTGGNIRSVPNYAAALHYTVSYFYLFFDQNELSENEVAKLYGVKLRALIDTIKKLDDVLENDINKMLNDLMYGFDDGELDDFFLGDDDDGFSEEAEIEPIDMFTELDEHMQNNSKNHPGQIVDELAKKRAEKKNKKTK